MAISLEPPPTSITATVPSTGASSVRVAPTKQSRASSSPDSTSMRVPACSTAASSSWRFGALRMAAVATVTTCSAPTSRATFSCSATTSAVSAILAAGIAPPASTLFPIRVKARCVTSSRSWPLPVSATSRRVVLLPMSMQAQIKGDDHPCAAGRAGCLRRRELRVRGILELPEQTCDDEGGLLADVDGIVADPLDAACHQHHVHRPLARVRIVADLERQVEDLAVEPVDLVVLAHQVLCQVDVAPDEGLLALDHLLARLLAHALEVAQDPLVGGRVMARQRHQLGHVHALIAHALHVLDDVEHGGHEPQVARHRRLQRQQRQHALVHLEVAAVDPVVVGDHHARQLDVLVLDCLQGPVQRGDDHVEAAEGLLLELGQLLLEMRASRLRHASRPCR